MTDCPCLDIEPDYGEQPSVHRVSTPKARKSHTCCECRGEIPAGTRYERVDGIWPDGAGVYKTCTACADIRQTIFCSGWTYGEMWDDLWSYEYLIANAAPASCILQELDAGAAELMKRKWAERALGTPQTTPATETEPSENHPEPEEPR